MGWFSDFTDNVLGFDPGGGGLFDIPIVGDVAKTVADNPALSVLGAAFLGPEMLGLGGAAGATAAEMAAADAAGLAASGLSQSAIADILGSTYGL